MKKFLVLQTKESVYLVNPYKLKDAIVDSIDFEVSFHDDIDDLRFNVLNERQLKEAYELGCSESGLDTDETIKSIEDLMNEAKNHELIF
jgi:hypothetical protein